MKSKKKAKSRGPSASGKRTADRQALDALCGLAAQLFSAEAACIFLKQDGIGRLVASKGIAFAMRSLSWDMSKVPYDVGQSFLLEEAGADSFAIGLFRELGLGKPGGLFRFPLKVTDDFSLALFVLSSRPLKLPTQKDEGLLEDTRQLMVDEFAEVEDILIARGNDVTVARTLAEMKALVATSSLAAFLLDHNLKIVSANARAAEMTGRPQETLVDLTHRDLSEGTADVIHHFYRHALETGLSTPELELVLGSEERTRMFRIQATPFSPTDTRDYFLFVTAQEGTTLHARAEKLARAIDLEHASQLPADPTEKFLLETLVQRRSIRQRKDVTYLSLRSWRSAIRDYQIAALKGLKQNVPAAFPQSIALEMAAEISNFIGGRAFSAVVPVPCGHSKGHSCLSVEIGRALGAALNLPVVHAFLPQSASGVSHPKENTKRPPLVLATPPAKPVILVDDVATSGAHVEEAVRLLRPHCGAVMPVVWIAGDAKT